MVFIVATLEEFRLILLGANIHVSTDHKNFTFDILKTQQVLCWRNKVEEYSPMLYYIEGPNNILSEIFSKLQRIIYLAQLAKGKKLINPVAVSGDEEWDYAYFLDLELSGLIDDDINDALEWFINIPD